jgi:hypothetical protein
MQCHSSSSALCSQRGTCASVIGAIMHSTCKWHMLLSRCLQDDSSYVHPVC